MRELQVFEINEVAGAGFFDRIGAGILGSMAFISTGMAKGGVAGGSTGGILGIGSFAATVTMIVGGVQGAIQGFAYGVVNGWDKTVEVFNNSTEQWLDLTVPGPKV